MVNLPSLSTEAWIQLPLQSADSSMLAIMSGDVLCSGARSTSDRCPCQMPSIPGSLASRRYAFLSYGAAVVPGGVADFALLSTCPRPFLGPLFTITTWGEM